MNGKKIEQPTSNEQQKKPENSELSAQELEQVVGGVRIPIVRKPHL